jgi:hypothetical protein
MRTFDESSWCFVLLYPNLSIDRRSGNQERPCEFIRARAIGANSMRVAECGGVSIGTLYQHYPKKQSLLFISTAGAAPMVRKLREHLVLFCGRNDTLWRFFTWCKAAT